MKKAAAGAAALTVAKEAAGKESRAAENAEKSSAIKAGGAAPAMLSDAEVTAPARMEALTEERSGSDFMVDVIKSLGIEYVCANPGSSFRGLQESIINYGGNKNPEFLTCTHEESSVAMGHGYAKVEGKPLLVCAHGTVGFQHAAMGIYNAYCDRVPVIIIGGNIIDATKRLSAIEWAHSVQDAAGMVRDYTKWDDTPVSLPHFAESAVRAYKLAMTPPMMPVVLVADAELQENPIRDGAALVVPTMTLPSPPQGESAAVAEAARMLAGAENPVIIADRLARTSAGMSGLIELAESLQAPVIDRRGRMNFPTRHPLNQSFNRNAVLGNADVILALEVRDIWGSLHSMRDQMERTERAISKPGVKVISINCEAQLYKSNYQDFQRYSPIDLEIVGDGEATLPLLREAVKQQLRADRKSALQERGARMASAHAETLQQAREAATYAWDASPISTARLCAEIWGQIKNEDWSLLSETTFVSQWPQRLWPFEKYHQFIGGSGGYGIGYGAPAAVGAALANRKHGRLSVNIQNDGDLMYGPGVLWTAAHHKIPLLTVMHNNRAYHQEVMQIQIMEDRRSRGVDRARIGTAMDEPVIDFAKLAQGLGVYAEGPITDPKELGAALGRAVEVVKRGEPALVDVHTQPR